MAEFVGLDVSLEATAICVVDGEDRVLRRGKAPSDPGSIAGWLRRFGVAPERVGLEAGPLSPWLAEGLRAQGLPAVCIETRRMKGVAQTMTNKTDAKDAETIARAMRTGWYTAVHVKSAEAQRLRLLLALHRQAVRQRAQLELSLRGALKAFGVKLGRTTAAGFRARVEARLAGRPELAEVVRPLLELLARTRAAQAEYQRQVRRAARARAECRLLMTAPGVGELTALTYVATVDDPARLRGASGAGALFGLAPVTHQSGELDRIGAISKAGDGLAREALFMAAHTLLTRSGRWSSLKAWGVAVAKRRGLRRATVAVARKLATILRRMWLDGAEFRWGRAPA